MKNKLTRKLMLSAFTLLFAVISLGASTYAWFTMSENANVEAFSAEVKAGEGIEIAVTSSESHANAQWYTGTVPTNIVQDVAVAEDFKFDAVTPVDGTIGAFNKRDGVSLKPTSEGYIAFYIHIKAAQAGTISLTDITFATTNDVDWKADAAYVLNPKAAGEDDDVNVSVNDLVRYKVENAARIALLYDSGNSQSSNKQYKVYEKVEDLDYTLVEGVLPAGNQIGCKNNGGSLSYYNSKVKESITAPTSDPYTSMPQIGGTLSKLDLKTVEGSTDVLTIQVKVWIEGWDAECLNAIFAQKLAVTLSFAYAPKQ